MFDIRLIRSDPDRVKQAMKTRNKDMDAAVDEVLKIDAERREILAKADGMKAQQNAASKQIPKIKKEGGDVSAIMAEMKALSEQVKEASGKAKKAPGGASSRSRDPLYDEAQLALTEHLGRRVTVYEGPKKGRIEIEFYSKEDLQTLANAIAGGKEL